MAFAKTASCLILAAMWMGAAEFPMRHEHLYKGCRGVMTVDESGVAFRGAKKHRWRWEYRDIQELTLSPGGVRLLTYRDSRLRLGGDVGYSFEGAVPAAELYTMVKTKMGQRLVAEIAQPAGGLSLAVKHLRSVRGSEGTLEFGADAVVYRTAVKRESRTWRYADIASIGSSGPFQFTLATLEKNFNFQLKEPLEETAYNRLWLEIEKKNGRIQ